MALNLGALKDFDKELDARTGQGNFLYQGKLKAEGTDFRIATPRANMNGFYYFEVIKWWIGGKPYISPATFGLPDPIQEEIDSHDGTKDKDIASLLADSDKCRKASEFLIPGWELSPIDDNYDNFKVVGDKATTLSCGVQLMKEINRIVTGRTASKIKSEDGITDRELGYNLLLSKIGSGRNNTEYKAAIADQFEMDEKYYGDDKIPDVIDMTRKQLKSDDYLLGVLANYLYGDAMPEDDKPAAREEKKPTKGRTARPEPEDDEPRAERRGRAASSEEPKSEGRAARGRKEEVVEKTAPKTRRSLLDDLDQ